MPATRGDPPRICCVSWACGSNAWLAFAAHGVGKFTSPCQLSRLATAWVFRACTADVDESTCQVRCIIESLIGATP